MRDYGKVYTAFWTSQDVMDMSEDARTLALYLLTCPHGNMLGCFRLTNAYAADDLKWNTERVSKGLAELFENGYAYRCQRSFWLVINRYLKWNQFENPNVGKAAGKLFETITPPLEVKALLVKALKDFCPTFPKDVLDKFDTLSIPFPNPFVLSPETVVGAVTVTRDMVATNCSAASIVPPPKKSPTISFKTYVANCKEAGIKPIPEDDPVFDYAATAKIPHEFLQLQWCEFRERYSQPDAKRYKNWKIVFNKSVRGNWFRLWYYKDNEYVLTTQGQQAKNTHGKNQ